MKSSKIITDKIITTDRIRSEITTQFHSNRIKEKNSKPFTVAINTKLNHKIWHIPPINLTPNVYFKHQKDQFALKSSKKDKYNNDAVKKTSNIKVDFPIISKHYCFGKQQIKRGINDDKEKTFITRFRIDSANTDRRKTLQTGTQKKQKYSQPRPHHFNDDIHRPLDTTEELGKEDFVVKIERDAGNINFKKNTLKLVMSELSCQPTDTTRNKKGFQMDTKKSKEPKFDVDLVLPKPIYQKGRSVQDVLYSMIADQTCLFPVQEKYKLDRPNIYDNKTVDFLEITRTGPRHKCLNCCYPT